MRVSIGSRGEGGMAVEVSDKVREALERLDQAIDRLDSGVTAALERAPPPAQAPPNPDGRHAINPALAERLDRIIERIEAAMVE
jgi:hypothetical protein